jgi:2-dehydro-3-deoxy-D-arabinonate dehydratase
MKLYQTQQGVFVEHQGQYFAVSADCWDELICDDKLPERLDSALLGAGLPSLDGTEILAPLQSQEVWAAGVTYHRSRDARMEESKDAGGGDFYDRIYAAPRPELFFKATASRVVRSGAMVRIRSDAEWSVPEPELTLAINREGRIIGYTIGNDMSSRDIEGLNPLYLPQAKVYNGSCAIGPCLLITPDPLPASTAISLQIEREGREVFADRITLASLKREPQDLVEYLYRELSFSHGAMLMTGTGIVPPDSFSLAHGDIVRISIAGIGTLENTVE